MTEPRIYIIHENEEWTAPLIASLESLGLPYQNWFLNEGSVDLSQEPPPGIFYNRMSASSHTRDHRFAIELTETVLSWLEFHGRRVLNGTKAIHAEVRKTEQLLALRRFGVPTPRSIVANNYDSVRQAARTFGNDSFIVKPNRGGKGTGVKLYHNLAQLEADILAKEAPESLDGILIVQEYVKPKSGRITRVEMIGGQLYYAVSVDATGGFELCPADTCDVEGVFCPADVEETTPEAEAKFKILTGYENPDVAKYQQVLRHLDISVGALEYAQAADGQRYVYDINTNTNYNSSAEAAIGDHLQGMRGLAEYLGRELRALRAVKAA